MFNWQQEWAHYKYWVMAHSQQTYLAIRELAKDNDWAVEKDAAFHQLLQSAAKNSPTKATLTTAYQHVWGYFKKQCTPVEKQTYLNLLSTLTPEQDQLGPFLKTLALKYQVDYLLQSKIIQDA